MKHLLVGVALILSLALAATPALPARADHGNDAGARWRGEGERAIPVLNALPVKWDPRVGIAVEAWNAAVGIDLQVERGVGCNEVSGVIVLCPVDSLTLPESSGLARMTPRFEYPGRWIISAVGEFVRLHASPRQRGAARRFQFLVCHELGHALGLLHPPVVVATLNINNGSCMGGGLWPDAHDLAEVARLHS